MSMMPVRWTDPTCSVVNVADPTWADFERMTRRVFGSSGVPLPTQEYDVTVDFTDVRNPVVTRTRRVLPEPGSRVGSELHRKIEEWNDEREEETVANFSFPPPPSPRPAGSRAEALRRRLDAVADELARLQARPPEPEKVGTVVRFRKRYRTGLYPNRKYTYAAVLGGGVARRWFVTGKYNAGKSYTWDELLDLVGDEDMGTLRVSSGWVPLVARAAEEKS